MEVTVEINRFARATMLRQCSGRLALFAASFSETYIYT